MTDTVMLGQHRPQLTPGNLLSDGVCIMWNIVNLHFVH